MGSRFCGETQKKVVNAFCQVAEKKSVAEQEVSKRTTSRVSRSTRWEKWVCVSPLTNEMRCAQPQTSEKSLTGPNDVSGHEREAWTGTLIRDLVCRLLKSRLRKTDKSCLFIKYMGVICCSWLENTKETLRNKVTCTLKRHKEPTHLTIILPKLAADLKHRDNRVTLLFWFRRFYFELRSSIPLARKRIRATRKDIFIQVFISSLNSMNKVKILRKKSWHFKLSKSIYAIYAPFPFCNVFCRTTFLSGLQNLV